jgi:hypothetical protein
MALVAGPVGVWSSPEPSPSPFSKGPYLQAPGADTMTILWESLERRPARLEYGLGRRLDQELTVPAPVSMQGVSTRSVTNVTGVKTNVTSVKITNGFFIYALTLTNLRPSTTYSYAVEMSGQRTARRQFRTFGANPRQVSFIAYGDSRSRPELHTRVARQFPGHDPAFLLHTGDLVARGRDYALWSREFFNPLRDVIDCVPILPALGNHEEDGTNYFAYFHLPDPERWYAFDVGPVHVLALDYHFEKADHPQFEFARRDLTSTRAPWKIVFLHYPVFNVGGHMTTWGLDTYLPLFHEAEVSLVLGGHSHVYERFRPVAPVTRPTTGGITFITTGGGGAPLYPVYDHPALAAKASTNHFVVFEATRERLRGRAYNTEGAVFDRFELRKGADRALAVDRRPYPEEALKLWFEISRQLTAALSAKPTPTDDVQSTFSLRPVTSSPVPAELVITLVPESAAHYQLVDGPLRGATPEPGAAARPLRGRIRLTSSAVVTTNSSGQVSPDLVFQAAVRSGGYEFISRGARSRVQAD